MQLPELVFFLSFLVTLGVALRFWYCKPITVALFSFVVTNAISCIGLIVAEAISNNRPAYSWRFGSRWIDGGFRGLGGFIFLSPILEAKTILGILPVLIFQTVVWFVYHKSVNASPMRSFQTSIQSLGIFTYFVAVIAWYVKCLIEIYGNRV